MTLFGLLFTPVFYVLARWAASIGIRRRIKTARLLRGEGHPSRQLKSALAIDMEEVMADHPDRPRSNSIPAR